MGARRPTATRSSAAANDEAFQNAKLVARRRLGEISVTAEDHAIEDTHEAHHVYQAKLTNEPKE